MFLGINDIDQTVYEGISTNLGRGIWPSPFLSQAKIFSTFPKEDEVPQSAYLHDFEAIFREDFFDPVTRIRRGRIYEISKQHSKPCDWISQPHPTMDTVELSGNDSKFHVNLVTFQSAIFGSEAENRKYRFVSLGDRHAHSIWKIIARERIQTGDFLVTLKSTTVSDLLPNIDSAKLTNEANTKITGFLDKVGDEAYRAGTESVIDRCRDAATALLIWGGYQSQDYKVGDDLGTLLDKMEKENKSGASSLPNGMIQYCGHIIRLLHSRAKPSVQERHSPPPLSDEDGILAVNSLARMIRELGLAKE